MRVRFKNYSYQSKTLVTGKISFKSSSVRVATSENFQNELCLLHVLYEEVFFSLIIGFG